MPDKAANGDKKEGAKKAATGAAAKSAKDAKKKSVAKPATGAATKSATAAAKTRSVAKSAAKTASADAPKESAAKSTRSKPAGPIKVRVRQVRSGIGHRRDFRRTLEALGIRHHQDEIVVKRSPAIDGMLYKVRHLIRVTPEE